jgi:hypothetical protein
MSLSHECMDSFPTEILDQLARIYPRAAVDAYLLEIEAMPAAGRASTVATDDCWFFSLEKRPGLVVNQPLGHLRSRQAPDRTRRKR